MEGILHTGIEMTDERLALEAASAADRELAFRRLVDQGLASSYRLAAALLGDRVEAEDATHDAVVRAWRSFGALRDLERFESWFQRIVVNCCRDRLRQRRARPVTHLLPELVQAAGSADPAVASSERDALRRALQSLTPDQRIVVVLRFYADLPIDVIAERLGQPSGTVKSRLHHALRLLRAAYDAGARPPRGSAR